MIDSVSRKPGLTACLPQEVVFEEDPDKRRRQWRYLAIHSVSACNGI